MEPVRTCVACRQEAGKRTLLRLVRKQGGGAVLDTSGKEPGRGAYLHRDAICMQSAQKRKALERALNTTIDNVVWAQIREQI